jgi:hypothetical protein
MVFSTLPDVSVSGNPKTASSPSKTAIFQKWRLPVSGSAGQRAGLYNCRRARASRSTARPTSGITKLVEAFSHKTEKVSTTACYGVLTGKFVRVASDEAFFATDNSCDSGHPLSQVLRSGRRSGQDDA